MFITERSFVETYISFLLDEVSCCHSLGVTGIKILYIFLVQFSATDIERWYESKLENRPSCTGLLAIFSTF